MAGKKLLQRLLRMKGFRLTGFELYERKRRVFIGGKPHKTGCRCPQGDRRWAIVTILADRLAKVQVILKCFRQAVLAAACSGRLTSWITREKWRKEKRRAISRRVHPIVRLP